MVLGLANIPASINEGIRPGPVSFNNHLLSIVPVFPADARNQLLALAESGLTTQLLGLGCIHRSSLLASLILLVDAIVDFKSDIHLRNYWIDEIQPKFTHGIYWPLIRERLRKRLGWQGPKCLSSDRMSRDLDYRAARFINSETKVVLGREDACVRSFARAKQVKALCMYDLPAPHIATVQRLMDIEYSEFPDASDETIAIHEYDHERVARKNLEMNLADRVLVASQMTERSIVDANVGQGKVVRIPYGCNPSASPQLRLSERKPVILYVGGCTMRKGITRLLRVWKKLKAHQQFTLRLIGNMSLRSDYLEKYRGLYEHVPAVPNSVLPRHYSEAYCFVFPTVADGFGLVINEALSHALPIVASANNGAPGFVEHGVQGLIYDHGDDDQLATHLDWMMTNPLRVQEMSERAFELSKSWTWQQYRTAYINEIRKLLNIADNELWRL